jgi:hypothetical protein
MLLALFAAAAVAAGAPATPAPAAAPAAATVTTTTKTTAVASNDAAKVTCTYEQVTGSRFPKKVCRNAEQTAEARAQQQLELRDMQKSGPTHY